MRGVWVDAHGPPEVLTVRDSPDPRPGTRQVLVAVQVCGVQFGETLLRSGARVGDSARKLQHLAPPFIPGTEVGGVVVEVGPEAPRELIGLRVIGRTAGSGGYASLAVLDFEALIPVPEGLTLEVAVALLAQGRTAVQVFSEARVDPGDAVLVLAAAGGVGNLIVQLAVHAGASPIVGAVGTSEKIPVVRDLGATACVDYSIPGWKESVLDATGGRGVEAVFESVGGPVGEVAFTCLAPGTGRLLVFGFASQRSSKIDVRDVVMNGVSLVGMGLHRAPSLEGLKALTREAMDLAAARVLKPLIGQRLPLESAADAHAAIEQRRTLGKTLLLT